MPDPHWDNLKEIFHAAVALPSNQRATYLDEACDGDSSLRAAVESLLKAHDETGNFVGTPAYQAAAEMVREGGELKAGQTVGHYRILSLLGEGGMGKVYLSEDTKLHRRVSLKFLSTNFTEDQQRLRRFEQEARAVSALNHPNILTIHEIGEAGGQRFIVTEFIEGQTLRERLRSALEIEEALEIAMQVASALVAAHRVNIVHRDIKPENIMIRKEDGLVKVLDFGLAKVTRTTSSGADSQVDTKFMANTGPGVVMGTVAYMSPEQARGDTVDERTDIWSLGVVLYEMVAGCSPFIAATSNEILSAILSKQPAPPLARYSRLVPERLEETVEKSLTKNRDERYQTSKDLLIDLKRLRQSLEVKASIERSTSPKKSEAPTTARTLEAKSNEHSGNEPTRQVTWATTGTAQIASLVTGNKARTIVAFGLLVAVAASLVYFGTSHFGGKGPITSLAVLPLTNMSDDPETEYLSDGFTDTLINNLSQLPNLKVMSRSSVFPFKGRGTDARTVGQKLSVGAVLTGRLLQRGDDLSISVELVDASDNSHIWGGQYKRKLDDVLAVQTEIARDISQRLRLQVAGDDEKRLTKHYTENAEAYQLYLKGRFYLNKRTRDAYKKAIEFFNQALELDPNYALAYSGLAHCYSLGDYPLPPKEKYPLAKRAGLKAVELDDTLAEPHAALGRIKQEYDWDPEGAEREFRRAIELDPKSSLAHFRFSGFFTFLGRHDEAIAEAKQALALDPLSPLINWGVAFAYYFARRYDEAIEQDRKTLEIDSEYRRAIELNALSYEQKGMFEKAFEWYLKLAQLEGNTTEVMAMKDAYAASGKLGYYRKQLDLESARRPPNAFTLAALYARLNEKEPAFEWLQKAMEERSSELIYLKVSPDFDNLRSDQRLTELMKRVGLSP